ncbi:MAG: Holliday junction branch migration protein RuvA [Ruminococcaceae bacterium]|nr:Holliday junction branch migration protein RuvA [Oscillospiraceae bacterium]
MIYSLRGEIIDKSPDAVVIECAGVGYRCSASLNTLSRLPSSGETFVYTYMLVREDSVELFAFADTRELQCFKLLISVSGVGPKSAISVLSDMNADKFSLAVAAGDVKAFTKAQGVGAKTAQRIILELKDKISKDSVAVSISGTASAVPISAGNTGEAIAALAALGYSQTEAASAVAKLDPSLSVNDMIKGALKALSVM